MADLQIHELPIGETPALDTLEPESLIPVEQHGAAMHMTGQQFADFAREASTADVQRAIDAADAAETAAGKATDAAAGISGAAEAAQNSAEAAARAALNAGSAVREGLKAAKESGEFDGNPGPQGDPGVSPIIDVMDITGGHRVTIVDADHPEGQSFDVMDGAGSGDMKASAYDPDGEVIGAGGIPAFVESHAPTGDYVTEAELATYSQKVTQELAKRPVGLTANVTYYVDAENGSDDNAGTSGAPLATLSAAFAKIPPDMGGFTVTIVLLSDISIGTLHVRDKRGGTLNLKTVSSGAATPTITGELWLTHCSFVSIDTINFNGRTGGVDGSRLLLKGLTIAGNRNCIHVENADVTAVNCSFTTDTANSWIGAASSFYGGLLRLKTCTISGTNYGLYAYEGGTIITSNVTNTANTQIFNRSGILIDA